MAQEEEEKDYPLPTPLEIHNARALRWQRRWDERRARLISTSTAWLDDRRSQLASYPLPANVTDREYIRGVRPGGYGREEDDGLFLLRRMSGGEGVECGVCELPLGREGVRMPCAEDEAHVFHRGCIEPFCKGAMARCPWEGCGRVYERLVTFPFEEKVELHVQRRSFDSEALSSSMTDGYNSPWRPGSERSSPKSNGGTGGEGGGGDGGNGGGGGDPPPIEKDEDEDEDEEDEDDEAEKERKRLAREKKKKREARRKVEENRKKEEEDRKKEEERKKKEDEDKKKAAEDKKKEKEEKKNPKKTKAQWDAERKRAAQRAAKKSRNRKRRHAAQAVLDEEEEERRKPMVEFSDDRPVWVTRREFYDFDYLPKEYTGRDRRANNRFRPAQGKGYAYRKTICGGAPGSNFRVVASDDKLWIQDRKARPSEWSREYDTLSESDFYTDDEGKKRPRRPVRRKKQSEEKKKRQAEALRARRKADRERMRELNRQMEAGTLSAENAGWEGAGPWSSDSDWSEPVSD